MEVVDSDAAVTPTNGVTFRDIVVLVSEEPLDVEEDDELFS